MQTLLLRMKASAANVPISRQTTVCIGLTALLILCAIITWRWKNGGRGLTAMFSAREAVDTIRPGEQLPDWAKPNPDAPPIDLTTAGAEYREDAKHPANLPAPSQISPYHHKAWTNDQISQAFAELAGKLDAFKPLLQGKQS